MLTYDPSRSRILLIDDSAALRSVMETLLRGIGVESIYATGDAGEAVVLANTCRPDIALVDYDIAGESGLDLIRRLRDPRLNPNPDLPLLLLTGHAEAHVVQDSVEAGADAYLVKPVMPEKLGQRIVQVLEKRAETEASSPRSQVVWGRSS